MSIRGRHDCTLDKDRRVVVPSCWRAPLLDGVPRLALGFREGLPVIELHSPAGLKAKLREIAQDAGEVPDEIKLRAVKAYLGGCRVARIDHRGRLTLPRDWCDAAGLEAGGIVLAVGRRDHAEFWNELKFEAADAIEAAWIRELNDRLDIF